MRKHHVTTLLLVILLAGAGNVTAQIRERPRPESWKQLVKGASFKDRFLPMPAGTLSRDTWGGANVLPRYTDNGIEDRERSYWCGSLTRGADSLYHFFVCGWRESSPKGHNEWPRSIVYHAVANNSIGPFVIRDTIGPGHNVEVFRLKDGRYVLYVIDKYYLADQLNGPWQTGKFEFDRRDRPIIEGLSNLTFARRPDGSYLMVCRGGGIWISQTGLSPYHQVSDKRVYPPVEGEFEDPVVWRDHVQYHLIVNDWLGRIAFYQRSKDGIEWVTDPGEAYTPGIAVHENGHKEDWFKYERMKVFQDGYGRAIQANFAVIDTLKAEDKPNDTHSSKNIGVPLNPGVLLEMLNKTFPGQTGKISVKLLAEPGFDPHKDVDVASLRFGASAEVNFGRGSTVAATKKAGKDLFLTFDAAACGLTKEEFAPKLIGRYTSGKMLYGYTRVPWVKYDNPVPSARKPVFEAAGSGLKVAATVENFGYVASAAGNMELACLINSERKVVATGKVGVIAPYGKAVVSAPVESLFEKGREYTFMLTVPGCPAYEFKAVPLP